MLYYATHGRASPAAAAAARARGVALEEVVRLDEVLRRHRISLGAPESFGTGAATDGDGFGFGGDGRRHGAGGDGGGDSGGDGSCDGGWDGGLLGCAQGIFPLSAACNFAGRVGSPGRWVPNATRWYDAERGLLITQTTDAIEPGGQVRVPRAHAPRAVDGRQAAAEAQRSEGRSTAETAVTTPLHVAAARGEAEACAALVAAGANVSAQDELGLTALEWAVLSGNAAAAGRLLTCGPKQAGVVCEGLTPLMLACAMGEVDVVAAMLQGVWPTRQGATERSSCTVVDGRGTGRRRSALTTSLLATSVRAPAPTRCDHLTAATCLPAGGVEGVAAPGARGLTPLDVATTLGHTTVAQLLREHGVVATAPTAAAGPRSFSMAEAVAEGRVRVMQAAALEGDASGWDAAFTDSVSRGESGGLCRGVCSEVGSK